MNPPSALHGAMSRERKPFTYTPGGINLSEIKSERMAKRLMRNAMDQGVPEHHAANLQSPPSTPSTNLNIPNFNCLPVQVFPTFSLPANPKTLLKTRSISSDYKERRTSQPEKVPDLGLPSKDYTINFSPQYNAQHSFKADNNRDHESYKSKEENKTNQSLPVYNNNHLATVTPYANYGSNNNNNQFFPKAYNGIEKVKNFMDKANDLQYIPVQDNSNGFGCEFAKTNSLYLTSPALVSTINNSEVISQQSIPENVETENKQKEVKVVKKQATTEDQNGETNVEAAVTVKLPPKKSAAKTETKVEVVKKVLPDGSIEEIKTTTTKTTIDGKTEITTKTETTIIPKEDDFEEEEVVEEEEEEEQEIEEAIENNELIENQAVTKDDKDELLEEDAEVESNALIKKEEESSESTVTKKVTIVQSQKSPEYSENEQEEEAENEQDRKQKENEEEIIIKEEYEEVKTNVVPINEEVQSESIPIEETEVDQEVEKPQPNNQIIEVDGNGSEVESEAEEVVESSQVKENNEKVEETQIKDEDDKNFIQSDENEKEENQSEGNIDNSERKDDSVLKEEDKSYQKSAEEATKCTQENKEEIIIEVQVLKPDLLNKEEEKIEESSSVTDKDSKSSFQTEQNVPLREPSVPLEKVEDVEIKPIGQIISKSHSENTEIITTSIDKPTTGLSTQTAYNRIENIVTVNRTTKTLDHAYEQINTQHNVPTVKTSYVPSLDNLSSSSPLSRPYLPVYPPEPLSESRHSLLLDRLSVDRQIPAAEHFQNNYQLINQNYEQNQWSQEPQSEVLTVSNVKPSTITKNQQWYQQTKKEDVTYNNTTPSLGVPSQQWNVQQSPPSPQPLLQSQPQQYLQPKPQQSYQPQPQYQSSYLETQDAYKTTSNSSSYVPNTYSNYTPKPTNWVNNNISRQTPTPTPTPTPTMNKFSNQYLYSEKDSTENYLKGTQLSSSYVPPPWEQDSSVVQESINQTYYTPPAANDQHTYINSPQWTPSPTNKCPKPKPTSYIPPAPNQSFVKPVTAVNQPKQPGRKTYYSEYERRYITVPESTYIPKENKFQAQPDPSPQYYYDNNEPSEAVEHEWRKELREFSEKTQVGTSQYDQTTVRPPWEEDPKYYVPKVTTEYNPTPTWSQTLKPNTWRERSFESEFVRSKELPRTNTLGRGRPQSSYVNSNISAPIPDRVRGVSVDRYNSNTYKSPVPSEHPPVVSHTLDPSIGSKTYHNPNVPAYHSRASAEPREQSAAIPPARHWHGLEARAPIQSRSFKYLQWITGTED